jgi:hypothetical protein
MEASLTKNGSALIVVLFILTTAITIATPSHALQFAKKGDVVTLSGSINSGDEHLFKDFMNDPAQANVKWIRLNSTGGKVLPARDMGRLIRSRQLSTIVDARADNCASACTVLFGAGVKRYYLNAGAVTDGVYGFKEKPFGLGFHEGNNPSSLDGNKYSGQATADMIAAYYEFGMKNAKDIITRAPPNKLYRVSSQTAMTLAIATHDAGP